MKTYNNLKLLYARRAIRHTHPLDFSISQFVEYFNHFDPNRLTTTPLTGKSGGWHFTTFRDRPTKLLNHLVKIGFLTTYKHGRVRLYHPTDTGLIWAFEEDEKEARKLLRFAFKVERYKRRKRCDMCDIKPAHLAILDGDGNITLRLCCWCFAMNYNEQITLVLAKVAKDEKVKGN